jgi:hypothetical protein
VGYLEIAEIGLWTTVHGPSPSGSLSGMETNAPAVRHWSQWPPVHTQADLERHWRELMGPLGFSETLLWVILFDAAGYPTPMIQQVADLPEEPDALEIAKLLSFCTQIIDDAVPDGSVAFLRTRPGSATWTPGDRAWAGGITQAARKASIRVHPVHLANDVDLRVFTPDDLAASA